MTLESESTYKVGRMPVMKAVVDVLAMIGAHKKATLVAKGDAIPSAVAIANIITEKAGSESAVESIKVDSDVPATMGRMISTIEISLVQRAGSL